MLFCFTGYSKTTNSLRVYEKYETISKDFQDGRKKTVSVKSYTRKNGTVVKAHKRRAPKRH